MNNKKPNHHNRQWRMLLIYNIYRLISIVALFSAYWFGSRYRVDPVLYFGTLLGFFLYGIVFLIICLKQYFKFQQQVLISGVIDIVIVVLLINEIGYIDSGLGVLLYVFVAMLSILVPGRIAIFFAAVASCLLLSLSIFKYLEDPFNDLSVFFTTGVYGAGFFATALTAWYLAHWVRSNEELANQRGRELDSLHKLNEYIVERLKYGVIYVDSKMQIKIINTAACHFFNLNCDKTYNLQQISSSLFKKYLKFIASQADDKNEQSAQTTIHDGFLQVRFYSSAASAEKSAVLIILNDTADIAQQAQQLKLASLGFFSASIAHELRNPLGAISHASQLLGEEEKMSDEDTKLKQLILRNCERMNNIIKNVLQVSRSEKIDPQLVDLNAFLNQFRKDFCAINKYKIDLKLPKKLIEPVEFDKTHLEQILVILCENALTHGRGNENKDVSIAIHLKYEAQKVILEVCDDGPGINSSQKKNIFDPFFSTTATGNGMGLFIAKDLCEINQSRLKLLDTKTGCCFAIYFNPMDEVTI